MNMAVKPADANDDRANAPEVMLDISNISLSFGGVHAIKDVSFNIHKGEIRAIIGPNGAGKTSMLNVINGFLSSAGRRDYLQGRTPAPRCGPMLPPRKALHGRSRTLRCFTACRPWTTSCRAAH